MKPSIALQEHRETMRKIVAGHRASNPRIFGAVLQGCDTEDSDLDLLVDPTPETTLLASVRSGMSSCNCSVYRSTC